MTSGGDEWTTCGISFRHGIRGRDVWVEHGTDTCMEKPSSYMISTPINAKKGIRTYRLGKHKHAVNLGRFPHDRFS